jgi:tRNA pseudouridine38-40 synthase
MLGSRARDDARGGMRNVRLTLEYDGTGFAGWQFQPGKRTVQGLLEERLGALAKERISVTGSGRTDAGVHALGQVANFRTSSRAPLKAFREGLNRLLPADVAVLEAREAPERFHARFDARSRRYRYQIVTRRSPVRERFAWRMGYDVDFAVLESTAKKIIGRHDFTSYCAAGAEVNSHFVTVASATWSKKKDTLTFEIEADRFLHHMVRILVGTMMDMARGKMDVRKMGAILKARDRTQAGRTAPAQGLFLMEVGY